MKENLRTALEKDKENGYQIFTVQIVISMLVNIMKIRKMEWVFTNGQMDHNTKAYSKTISKTVKEQLDTKMARLQSCFGRMASPSRRFTASNRKNIERPEKL